MKYITKSKIYYCGKIRKKCQNYIVQALRILLTIPVTVAATKRSFSILKILENILRKTTIQGGMNDLAIISIEKTIYKRINYKDAIDQFAAIKARTII